MRRTFLTLLACSLAASLSVAQDSRPISSGALTAAAPAVSVPTFHNETCPVMNKPAKTNLFVETPNGRVYVCCKMCVKKIEADAEAMYKKAYASTKSAGNKTCPVSGEVLTDKSPKVTVQGVEIGICCNDCAKPLRENAQIHLARLANPKIKDLGNKTDPVSGKPVANNAFCLVGDDLIHLSGAESVDEVAKDPKKALEKAKEGKAGGPSKDAGKKTGPQDGGCCSGGDDDDLGGCCSGKPKAESKPSK